MQEKVHMTKPNPVFGNRSECNKNETGFGYNMSHLIGARKVLYYKTKSGKYFGFGNFKLCSRI